MPIVKLYHHGLTAGIAPTKNSHPRAKRDVVQGWTAKTARSNTAFLRSVHLPSLTGIGLCFTLTVKDCPETHEHWKAMRQAFIAAMRRQGMIRLHWVTEWQKRRVPHLHGVVYFPDNGFTPEYRRQYKSIEESWCRIAYDVGAAPFAQHVALIKDSLGWLKYLAKHASRGANHYQRSADAIPPGWKKTGRIWGKVGDWPTDNPMQFQIGNDAYYAYRRIVRSWRKSQARVNANAKSIQAARTMLKCCDKNLSSVRGISEWISEDLNLQIFTCLGMAGYDIEQVD